MAGSYMNGHQTSVLRSHTRRTAEDSAAYLLSYLEPDMHILDVGCGPGTITIDFATRVPKGKVVGLEQEPEVLKQARATASERKIDNVQFVAGDLNSIPYPDGTFDVVHAHQVIQYVPDPVKALAEMRRVTKRGGIIAVRDSDFAAMAWYPEIEAMTEWHRLFLRIARVKGGEPNAGRRLVAWATQAGIDRSSIKSTATTWCYNSPEVREWWGNLWADRVLGSNFAQISLKEGLATQSDLERIAQGWRDWSNDVNGWFGLLHGEIICRV
jgi:ubiquinone/menaquinone biosynthesis C-methylase UbiE